MRCKSCDYPLWNLNARHCPECGSPFAPSEFEFVPHAVAYCCPHCEQTYYGTSEVGHLEPSEFECITCSKFIRMDEMVLRPTEGVAEDRTRLGDMPWFDRGKRGVVKSWFATIWMAMIQPAMLMRGVPESSSVSAAFWYATLTNVIFTVARLVPMFCCIPLLIGGVGGRGNTGLGSGKLLAIVGAGGIVGILGTLVIIFVSLAIWGLVTHAALRVSGETAGGLGRTFHAICYSSGANAISIIPFIGDFAFIWWIVSAVIMVREGQRVSGVRATFATLALPIGLTILLGGLAALFLGSILSTANAPMPAQVAVTQQAEIITIGVRVTSYAAARNGAPPEHALELVSENASGTGIFISASSGTGPDGVPVNDGTLRDFQLLGVNRQRAAAQRAADALPENVVAHRVGDFVFTWHGINLNTADPELWLAIASPDPGMNPGVGMTQPAVALFAGGRTIVIQPSAMPGMLLRQNQLRASLGLAPLPDPSTVTHESAAIGGGE